MSHIGECPRGGQQGILVSNDELSELARELGKKYIDAVIPLPNMDASKQKEAIKECGDHSGREAFENAKYWESETGSHGWCCTKCGTTLQWG